MEIKNVQLSLVFFDYLPCCWCYTWKEQAFKKENWWLHLWHTNQLSFIQIITLSNSTLIQIVWFVCISRQWMLD